LFAEKEKAGWGTWIRTKTNGVRVRCSTIKLSPTEAIEIRRLSESVSILGEGFFPHRGRRGDRVLFGLCQQVPAGPGMDYWDFACMNPEESGADEGAATFAATGLLAAVRSSLSRPFRFAT
jgi:hypothetical protein